MSSVSSTSSTNTVIWRGPPSSTGLKTSSISQFSAHPDHKVSASSVATKESKASGVTPENQKPPPSLQHLWSDFPSGGSQVADEDLAMSEPVYSASASQLASPLVQRVMFAVGPRDASKKTKDDDTSGMGGQTLRSSMYRQPRS